MGKYPQHFLAYPPIYSPVYRDQALLDYRSRPRTARENARLFQPLADCVLFLLILRTSLILVLKSIPCAWRRAGIRRASPLPTWLASDLAVCCQCNSHAAPAIPPVEARVTATMTLTTSCSLCFSLCLRICGLPATSPVVLKVACASDVMCEWAQWQSLTCSSQTPSHVPSTFLRQDCPKMRLRSIPSQSRIMIRI